MIRQEGMASLLKGFSAPKLKKGNKIIIIYHIEVC